MFIESHPRPHSPVLSPQRSDLKTFRRADDPYLAKPFPVNLFADPHPLNPYATILYEKGGRRGLPDVQIEVPPALWSGDPGRVGAFQRVSELSPFFSNHCALFCTHEKLNSFPFNRFRTLCEKPPGVGVLMAEQLTLGFNVSTFKPFNVFSVACFSLSGRTVAFPQHRTSRPLCSAPRSGTIEVHAGAEPASQTRPLADGRRIATSWVR